MSRLADYLAELNGTNRKKRDTEEILLILFSGVSLVLLLLIIFAGRIGCNI
jgi:hypothetical protein